MRFDEAYSGNVFIKSHPNYDEAQAVIYGMPMDWTVCYRPGSRFGPQRIREVSIGLEEYSPYLDRDLDEVNYFDAGDIPFHLGMRKKFRSNCGFIRIVADGKIPVGMGGEHLVSWPVMKTVADNYEDLAIIHMDAHTDLRVNMKEKHFLTRHQFVKLPSISDRKMSIHSAFVQDERRV